MLKRTITGILAGAYVIAMILLGRTALLINVVLLLLIGTYELLSSLKAGGFQPLAWVYGLYVLLLVPAYLWLGEEGLFLLTLVGALGGMATAVMRHEPDARELLAALLPAVYPALPIMALCILIQNPAPHWRLFIWLTFALPVGSDTFAIYFGRAFGKHKLIPRVSPNKTVEGAVGGVLGSIFAALIAYCVSLYYGDGISLWVFLGLGVFGSVLSQVGDLVASYIKRICGVKDFGKLFPGHGGLMDRLDGILYNAVALCIFVLLTAA